MVNVNDGSARELQCSSFLDIASNRLSDVFGNTGPYWRMKTDLLSSRNLIVFFTHGQSKIDVVNLQTMLSYSMSLPCDIESILLASDNKWLIQDMSKNKYILTKSSDQDPCPNILRELNESNSAYLKAGSVLSCGPSSLSEANLSEALQQKINSPNRVIVTDNTYAGIVIGFPDLDGSNDLHFWPRKGRTRSFMTPIVTQRGQVIRTASSDQVPDEICPKDKRHVGISGYLEIVDTVYHKLRYIPVPE